MDYSHEARIRFREAQEFVGWARLSMVGAVVSVGVGAFVVLYAPGTPESVKVFMLIALLMVVFAVLEFRRLEIVVDDENLRFGFRLVHPVVPLKSILSCEPEKITLWKYGGIGIRVAAGAVCYNTRFGDGVRIRVEGRRRDWVFSCDDSARLLALLNDSISKHGLS